MHRSEAWHFSLVCVVAFCPIRQMRRFRRALYLAKHRMQTSELFAQIFNTFCYLLSRALRIMSSSLKGNALKRGAAGGARMSSPAACGACKAVPTAPHELPCGHTHCFVCLDSRATAVKIDARSPLEEQSAPLRLVLCPRCQKVVEFAPPYARARRIPS